MPIENPDDTARWETGKRATAGGEPAPPGTGSNVIELRRHLAKRPAAALDSHPVITVAGLTGLAAALLALLVSFGVDLTSAQQTALLTVFGFLAPVIAGIIARRWAWSPRSVRRIVRDAEQGADLAA